MKHKSLGIWFKLVIVFIGIFALMANEAIMAQSSYTQNGGTATKTGETFTASSTDESGVLVENSGVLTMSNCIVTTSGNTSSSDNSSFYGLNAGVLATSKSTITMTGGSVTTTGTGANGIFAYGSGASVIVSDVTVTCSAQYAHAVMTSGGGSLTVTNVNMSTAGMNSGAIATDRGSGTITVTGGTVITTGKDSPGIYSTGVITVNDATVSATASEASVIEGKNNVILNNVTLSGGNSNYGGIMIMQSMSGDADQGTGVFTVNGGSIKVINNGPLFFVTNNTADITLKGVSLDVPSGVLINAAGTDRWGTSGKNGGQVTFTANGQTLSGNITIDNISTFEGSLENSTTLTGAINNANTAETSNLTMDASSTWTLSANSYLSAISNSDGLSGSNVTNITGNGFNVYYDSDLSANSYLGGASYDLVNGGKLMPENATSVDDESYLPIEWKLEQNYPNPFNPETLISYQVPASSAITLQVFDTLGREVETLVNEVESAGSYQVKFNANNYPAGMYIYRIIGENFVQSKKMLLTK